MPRPPRLDVPGVPVHVVQRGVNRGACFFSDVDRRYYLKLLTKYAARRQCAVHGYVLMTNHVHLLITPAHRKAIAALMQDLGRAYVQTINAVHERTGALWEGRFKSSPVDSDRYLLACHRYIDLNPVRAGMVRAPGDYPWSSHGHYAGTAPKPFLVEHECVARLGAGNEDRRRAYVQLFDEALNAQDVEAIRTAANANAALGKEDFVERLSALAGRNAGPRRRGRPPKAVPEPSLSSFSNNRL